MFLIEIDCIELNIHNVCEGDMGSEEETCQKIERKETLSDKSLLDGPNLVNAKELWDKLETRYMTEDATSKKFLISRFNNYQMVDGCSVMEQFRDIKTILNQFMQYDMKMDEIIVVSSIRDKLPPYWKDFKRSLKHKKEKISLETLANHLRIEEDMERKGKCICNKIPYCYNTEYDPITFEELRDARFLHVARMGKGCKLDLILVSMLMEMWKLEIHTFDLPFGKCTITFKDVQLQLGLPVDGPIVTGLIVAVDWRDVCEQFLGRVSNAISRA
ncbi:hypothetical protein J1N35_007554 [Gossypium stocksii]|uniref:Aminotransferase-like plant mobile domain-containing protein n=1 Tax=Gossypium stocksii TaxID=47602 RepID=A0A9D3W7I0_9ROSI|nr:hypothetical protein J1N35_007554 [Gossypium stocksii]